MPPSPLTSQYVRLRELLARGRRERGLTQTELAERLGKPQSFVSKYERGERRLDLVEFLQIARGLEIDPCIAIRLLTEPHEIPSDDPR